MATKLVKGTPIVSLANGETLGTIDHVYFDPQEMAVVGFTFHQRGGLFGGGASGLVDISDVRAFGEDAVTIDDVAVVRSDLAVAAREGLLDLEELLRRRVMTESGILVGHVAAIQFGDASHALVALDVTPEGSDTPSRIDAAAIKTIGPELIIIADPARAEPRTTSGRTAIVRDIRPTRTVDEGKRLRVVGA